MQWKRTLRSCVVLLSIAAAAVVAGGQQGNSVRDPWVHPRGEKYDPERHYKDAAGEIYYKAENDIAQSLGDIVVRGGAEPSITADLGPDLWRFAEETNGSLRPVLLFDSDGDDIVDRSIRGRIQDENARFDSPSLAGVDLRHRHWQIGIVYDAGGTGAREFDGRYLASVDSRTGKVVFERIEELAHVGAGGATSGLVIFKHREGAPIDLADFSNRPEFYLQSFERLTPIEDADDWTVRGGDGRLRTHFDREDLLLVRTEGNLVLDIEWGDMAVDEFLREQLAVKPDSDGCYNTLESELVGSDGKKAPLPHRLLYCPEDSVALFDAPDGYQIFLSALDGEKVRERTEVSTSILDNVKLYAREINRRSPRSRSTGAVWGNVVAGFKDAGHDLVDVAKNALTGTHRRNVHTGQMEYRASPVTAVPRALWKLARLQPMGALGELSDGAQSAIQIAADGVSAVNNAVANPILQSTVGVVGSPEAADTAGHWFGAFDQAVAQNLPLAERSSDALNPMSLWYHNRAFAPSVYTRTDTQLNIDRVLAIAEMVALGVIIDEVTDDGDGGGRSGSNASGNTDATPKGGCSSPGLGFLCKSRGAPKGHVPIPQRSEHAFRILGKKFCHHPTLDHLLPVKF